MKPNHQKSSYYWVQNGASEKPFMNNLTYNKISDVAKTNAVNAFDGDTYRLLIGPFLTYNDAYRVMRYVTKLTQNESFIRQATFTSSDRDLSKAKKTPHNLQHTDKQGTFLIPTVSGPYSARHYELGNEWGRLSYYHAQKRCNDFKGDLISSKEMDQLKKSADLSLYPTKLPYWLKNGTARFLNDVEGIMYYSPESSQLLFICTRPTIN